MMITDSSSNFILRLTERYTPEACGDVTFLLLLRDVVTSRVDVLAATSFLFCPVGWRKDQRVLKQTLDHTHTVLLPQTLTGAPPPLKIVPNKRTICFCLFVRNHSVQLFEEITFKHEILYQSNNYFFRRNQSANFRKKVWISSCCPTVVFIFKSFLWSHRYFMSVCDIKMFAWGETNIQNFCQVC